MIHEQIFTLYIKRLNMHIELGIRNVMIYLIEHIKYLKACEHI